MSTDHEVSGDYGDQLTLEGCGVTAGDMYQNVHTDSICVVTEIDQHKYCWVKFRRDGRDSSQPLATFLEHHREYRLGSGRL